ncbi:MAG: lipopolysaccharide core heptose(I) kinase RfaP [Desulfobacterales bacterium]|nr:lipopolysaccharide core heptose(I) kinase RfaP [Deltaproteobacteria bacterium]NIR14808.1 lipopolysaccharide core heptose(I) kinase RfaP [Desulfobacterales bacterium]
MAIQVVQLGNLYVNRDFSEFLDASGLHAFDDFMRLEGMMVKSAVRERSTQRLDVGGVTVYIKKHFFPGIREILKNLIRLRFPTGALNEWRALLAFHAHNIPTMTPICAGRKPLLGKIEKASFLLTDDLGEAHRLDDFLKTNGTIPCRGEVLETKKRILENLADITRKMHSAGINHKDYYLCHILMDNRERLYVIDLHRVNVSDKLGKRWMVKDLAAMLFSSLEVPVTHGQRLAFYKRYMQISRLSADDKTLIRLIVKKCNKIARHTEKMYRTG